jgi:hypothetical protein
MLLGTETVREYHITRTGLHEFEEVKCYSLGDRVLWSPGTENKVKVILKSQSHRMAVDFERYSERDAFMGISELISLTPDAARVIFAHTINGLTRTAYIAASITPSTAIEVIGKSGTLKTTYTPLLAQVYNRDSDIKPETRLNSTQRYIEELLSENCEFTTIIDDLHTAESKGQKRINEATKEEITRRIGDDTGRGRMEGSRTVQKRPGGNAIFIGEYLSGVKSTVARGLAVGFDKPDGRRLRKFQREPLIVSTFYYYFLAWFVENFDNIRDALIELLDDFHGSDLDGVHLRLHGTQFCLFTGYMMFWKYSLDRGSVSTHTANSELNDFWSLLSELTKSQDERIEKEQPHDSVSGKIEPFDLIRTLYTCGSFSLAKSKKRYEDDPQKYDGLIHDELLCLRSESLSKWFQKMGYTNTPHDIRKSLISKQALRLDSQGKNYKVGNARFYGIYLDKLK